VDRLLQDDYFKRSTRQILSESEKQEMVLAAERALAFLNAQVTHNCPLFRSPENAHEDLKRMIGEVKILDRCVTLAKGYSQPRHLYRVQDVMR
jgi:hypothetical protein